MAPDIASQVLPRRSARAPTRGRRYYDTLALVKARLMIFLYRHPLANTVQVIDVIDNAASLGEAQLLLDYILARLVRVRAALSAPAAIEAAGPALAHQESGTSTPPSTLTRSPTLKAGSLA